jgi:formiminotetrahydrofolate cyclodeaminase
MTDKSCTEFTQVLASKAPVPGGGSAAALVGAFGTALCSMAGNLTVGNKKYTDVEADVYNILKKAKDVQARMLDLVDKDVRAFKQLSEAYAISKDDPRRAQVIENATYNACVPPFEIMNADVKQ